MNRSSLRVRMVTVFGILITAVAGFMVWFFPARMAEQAQASAELRARTVTQVMASALAPALEFDDADNAAKVLSWLGSSPDAKFAVVITSSGARFATWGANIPDHLPTGATEIVDHQLVTSAAVVGRGGGRGKLYVSQSLEQLVQARDAARRTVVTASIVVLGIGLLACVVLATALVRPLERLTTIAHDIARGAKPPRIVGVVGGREVVEMTSALGTMLDRLNDTNRQLVDASRHAGMAEVATGVLHNVGNILTSVNVGLEVVNEHVGAIPDDRVRRAGELLAGARSNGAVDPTKLDAGIRYLAAIADHMRDDRSALLKELVTLRGHVDHVNRVIMMQNTYARTGGLNEQIELETLIGEAIDLGCPDPQRHAIEIVRTIEPGPRVSIDRHRVLQILVNLLANARDAVTAPGVAKPPRISVISTRESGWLEIRVEDTGSGIAPESLVRIFNAGFTTKPKGHGYGLHSSSLAAEQLGGELRCSSAGPGRGACFTLRVPTEPARTHVE